MARDLLGKRLVRLQDGCRLSGLIVETEAYCDSVEPDLACHAARANNGQPTKRTAVIFGPAGVAYVYFIYGMYWMFNVVTGQPGQANAVLVRALEPVEGVEEMRANRNGRSALTNGPGKLAQALGTRWLDERNKSHVYLAATDTKKDDPLQTAIPLGAMQEFMTTLPTQKRVLAIDACFTGTGKVDSEDAEAAAKATVDEEQPFADTTRGKEAQLFATTYGRPALEAESRGHGVYTHHLIASLKEHFDDADINGDKVVTVSEAHDYARDKTLDETGERQIPMAFYRIVGREDLLLSGSENNRLRAQYALLTSYGKPQQGLVVFIDGEEKGAFPRTILIDPGPHQIEFKNLKGRRIDGGRVTFKPETPYDVARIRDELNGGRHQLSVGYAHWWVPGAMITQESPQANGVRVGYNFRFPSKSPVLRRLGLGFDVAVGVFEPTLQPGPRIINGTLSGDEFLVPRTVMLEVGVGPLLRLDIPFGLFAMQPRVALVNLFRTQEAIGIPNWLYLAGGADFIAGVRPHNRVSIQGRYSPMLYNSRLEEPGPPKLEVSHRLGVNVEVGF